MINYSAAWFAGVLDAMSEMVLVKGPRSQLLWANQAFLKYYGMSNEELEGVVDAKHSDPDDTLQYVRDDHHVFTSGERLDVDEPVTNSVGSISYFNTVKTAIRDKEGTIARTVGVSRLIGGSRAEREAEARAEAKSHLNDLRVLVEHIPIAVAMLDAKQRISARSRVWDSLMGTPDLSKCLEEQALRLPVSENLNAAIVKGEPFVLEAVKFSNRLVNVQAQPFSLPSGETGGVILVVHDVTPLHRQRIELERLNDELTQFNYRVSHDIVGPIRTLKGLVSVVSAKLTKSSDEMVTSTLSRMSGSLNQLEELIEGLVNLARADIKVKPERVDLKELIQQILKQRSSSDASKIHLALDCPQVQTERVRLQQCLENLIGNALKYEDPNATTPRVEVRSAQDASGATRLEISDNGIGVDDAHTEKIFEKFWRGSAGHRGSGLGLHLVQKHMERLGGNVQLIHCRKPTVFRLTLPEGTSEGSKP